MHTRIPAAAALAALFGASSGADVPFSFDDIHYWVGEGTNRAAVVIDWGREGHAPRAWGYRWNGDATAADALRAIVHEDNRLHALANDASYSTLYALGYDVANVDAIFHFDYNNGNVIAESSDLDALAAGGWYNGYWGQWICPDGEELDTSFFSGSDYPNGYGLSFTSLAKDSWHVLQFQPPEWNWVTHPLSGVPAPAEVPSFTFNDIHYWVGEGTNRAALVVDFSRDGYFPRAWGYRWNGNATAADALAAIVHDDNRFHALANDDSYSTLYALGYDLADLAAAFRFDYNRGNVVAEASDADAFAAGGWFNGYWSQWVCPVGDELNTAFFSGSEYPNGYGLSFTSLANDSWHVLQFQRPEWGYDTRSLSGGPLPAESPYGWHVVAADVADDADYGNPANALGAPSRTVPPWGNIPPTTVNPASPAWGADSLVSLASSTNENVGGSITVEFDHPVVDDSRNPFGLDFIVFGNAMQTLGGNAYFNGVSDPASVRFSTDTIKAERGLVEVSADGVTWFSFANGPYADDFAPTLSHRYDPANADANLFAGNLWWGTTADATRPVDPAVTATTFKGRTLAEYATLYDGSAGGTGFDIAGFDLPQDSQGRKWIRFVRITSIDAGDDTEIDAIADVSPAPSFRNWVDTHVAFADRPGYATTNVCANGLPAYVNAALGLAPDTPSDGAFSVTSFAVEDGAPTLQAPLAPYAYDLVRLRWSDSLETPAARWQTTLPIWHTEGAEQSHAEGAESAEFSSRISSQAPDLSRPAQARPDPALRVPAAAAPDGAAFYRIELHD